MESLEDRWWSYLCDMARFDLGGPMSPVGRAAIAAEWLRLDTLDDVLVSARTERLIRFCVRRGLPEDRVRARVLVGAAQARRRPADDPHAALDRQRAAEARQHRPTPTKGRTDDRT
jgi:hypothetical protein